MPNLSNRNRASAKPRIFQPASSNTIQRHSAAKVKPECPQSSATNASSHRQSISPPGSQPGNSSLPGSQPMNSSPQRSKPRNSSPPGSQPESSNPSGSQAASSSPQGNANHLEHRDASNLGIDREIEGLPAQSRANSPRSHSQVLVPVSCSDQAATAPAPAATASEDKAPAILQPTHAATANAADVSHTEAGSNAASRTAQPASATCERIAVREAVPAAPSLSTTTPSNQPESQPLRASANAVTATATMSADVATSAATPMASAPPTPTEAAREFESSVFTRSHVEVQIIGLTKSRLHAVLQQGARPVVQHQPSPGARAAEAEQSIAVPSEAPPRAARSATPPAAPPSATPVRATIKPTAHVATAVTTLSPETQLTPADATPAPATAAQPVNVIANSAATAQLQAASLVACHPVSATQASTTKAAAVLATTASPAFVSAFAKAATPCGSSVQAAAPTPSAVTTTAASASIPATFTSASANAAPENTSFSQVPTRAVAADLLSAPPQPAGAAYQPNLLPQPVEAATATTSPATADPDCVNATGAVANTAVASSRAMFAAAPRSGSHLQATATAHFAHAPAAESRPPHPPIQPPIATATMTAMPCAPREPEPATDTSTLPATVTSKLISPTPAGSSIDSPSQTERETAFGNLGAERQQTAAMPSTATESTAAAVANAPAKAASGNRSSLLRAMPTIAAESPSPPQLAGETRQPDLMPQQTVTSTATSVTLIVPRDMPSSTAASSSSAPLQRKQKLKPVSEVVSKQVPSPAEAATKAAQDSTSVVSASAAFRAATPDSATRTKSSSEQAGPSIINAPSPQPRATAAPTTAVYLQTESDSAAVHPSLAAAPTTEPQVEQASTPASAAAIMATTGATRFTTAVAPPQTAVLSATSSMSLLQCPSPTSSIASEISSAASLDWSADRNEADSASGPDQQQPLRGVITPWASFRQQIIEATREAANIEFQVCQARRTAALAEYAFWEAKCILLRPGESKQNEPVQPSKQPSESKASKASKPSWNCAIKGHFQSKCRKPRQHPLRSNPTSRPPVVQCWSCGRCGHFSRECRSHLQSQRSHQRDQEPSRYALGQPPAAAAHQVVARRHTNAIFCVDGQPLLITLQINDVSVQALIDTGSSVSLISGEIAQAIPGLSDTLTTGVIPATMSVAGEQVELLGQVSGDITIGTTTLPFTVQVCAKLQCQALLGTDFLRRVGPTAIDYARGEFFLGGHIFPIYCSTDTVSQPEDNAAVRQPSTKGQPLPTGSSAATTAEQPDIAPSPHPSKRSRRQHRAEASKDSKFCWKCDITGHFVRECPQRQPMQTVINQPVCPVYLIVQQPPPAAIADANVNVVYQSTSIERPVDQQTAISSASAETQCSLQVFSSQAPAAPQASCQPLSLRVKLNDIEVIAIVDIGSAISLIDQGFVKQNPCVAELNKQWVPEFPATTCEVQQHAGFTGYIYTALAIGNRAEQVSINVYKYLPCQLLLGIDLLQLYQQIVLDFVRSHAHIADVKVPLLNEFEPGLASFRVSLKDATEFQAKQDLIVFAKIERLFDITVQERLSDRIISNGYGFFEGMSAFASHHPINALSALVPSTNGEVPVRLINTTDAVAQLQGGAHLGTFTVSKCNAVPTSQPKPPVSALTALPEAPDVPSTPADRSREPDKAKDRERQPFDDWSTVVQAHQAVHLSDASSEQQPGNCTTAVTERPSPPRQQSAAEQPDVRAVQENQDDLLNALTELSDCLASYHQQTPQPAKQDAVSASVSVSKDTRQQSQRSNYRRAEPSQQTQQQGNFAIECINALVIVLALLLLLVSNSNATALQSTSIPNEYPVVMQRPQHHQVVNTCPAFEEQLTASLGRWNAREFPQQQQRRCVSPSLQPSPTAKATTTREASTQQRPTMLATTRSVAAATGSKSQPTGATPAAATEMPLKHQRTTEGTASHRSATGSTAVQQAVTEQTTDNATSVQVQSTPKPQQATTTGTTTRRTPCQSTTRDSTEQPPQGQPTTTGFACQATSSLSTERPTIKGRPRIRAASTIHCAAASFAAANSTSGLANGPSIIATTSAVALNCSQAANRRKPIERVHPQQPSRITKAAQGNVNAEDAAGHPATDVSRPHSAGLCNSQDRNRPASFQAILSAGPSRKDRSAARHLKLLAKR